MLLTRVKSRHGTKNMEHPVNSETEEVTVAQKKKKKSLPSEDMARLDRDFSPNSLSKLFEHISLGTPTSYLTFLQLPDELLFMIFSHLSWIDLVTASQVCTRWRQIIITNLTSLHLLAPALGGANRWFGAPLRPLAPLSLFSLLRMAKGLVSVDLAFEHCLLLPMGAPPDPDPGPAGPAAGLPSAQSHKRLCSPDGGLAGLGLEGDQGGAPGSRGGASRMGRLFADFVHGSPVPPAPLLLLEQGPDAQGPSPVPLFVLNSPPEHLMGLAVEGGPAQPGRGHRARTDSPSPDPSDDEDEDPFARAPRHTCGSSALFRDMAPGADGAAPWERRPPGAGGVATGELGLGLGLGGALPRCDSVGPTLPTRARHSLSPTQYLAHPGPTPGAIGCSPLGARWANVAALVFGACSAALRHVSLQCGTHHQRVAHPCPTRPVAPLPAPPAGDAPLATSASLPPVLHRAASAEGTGLPTEEATPPPALPLLLRRYGAEGVQLSPAASAPTPRQRVGLLSRSMSTGEPGAAQAEEDQPGMLLAEPPGAREGGPEAEEDPDGAEDPFAWLPGRDGQPAPSLPLHRHAPAPSGGFAPIRDGAPPPSAASSGRSMRGGSPVPPAGWMRAAAFWPRCVCGAEVLRTVEAVPAGVEHIDLSLCPDLPCTDGLIEAIGARAATRLRGLVLQPNGDPQDLLSNAGLLGLTHHCPSLEFLTLARCRRLTALAALAAPPDERPPALPAQAQPTAQQPPRPGHRLGAITLVDCPRLVTDGTVGGLLAGCRGLRKVVLSCDSGEPLAAPLSDRCMDALERSLAPRPAAAALRPLEGPGTPGPPTPTLASTGAALGMGMGSGIGGGAALLGFSPPLARIPGRAAVAHQRAGSEPPVRRVPSPAGCVAPPPTPSGSPAISPNGSPRPASFPPRGTPDVLMGGTPDVPMGGGGAAGGAEEEADDEELGRLVDGLATGLPSPHPAPSRPRPSQLPSPPPAPHPLARLPLLLGHPPSAPPPTMGHPASAAASPAIPTRTPGPTPVPLFCPTTPPGLPTPPATPGGGPVSSAEGSPASEGRYRHRHVNAHRVLHPPGASPDYPFSPSPGHPSAPPSGHLGAAAAHPSSLAAMGSEIYQRAALGGIPSAAAAAPGLDGQDAWEQQQQQQQTGLVLGPLGLTRGGSQPRLEPLPLEVLVVSVWPLHLTDAFALALGRHCPALRSLVLSSETAIGDAGVEALIRGCPCLEVLNLSSARLTDGALTNSIARSHSLRRLILQNNDHITPAGIRALASTLSTLRHLHYLDVSFCAQLTNAGPHHPRWAIFTHDQVIVRGLDPLCDGAAVTYFDCFPCMRQFLTLKPRCKLAVSYGGFRR
ncbi:hypothetical protein PAPYR_7436 [Paratrimastix pyriformis]|uniref:F-box domain-containing protein n=1 Tax=Paratrimastix pyriformis TaxID=342808 RepID=A0ABQ8UIA2_9EUKA|nr:hypothetical protein PAPYR_7436 [Paratrimastix pyriformis]